MARFSLRWMFVGMAFVALAITAVQNANLTWLFITVVGTMLALQRLAQLPHFTPPAVGGFGIVGVFCMWFVAWVLEPHGQYRQPFPSRVAILFFIGLLVFVCVQGIIAKGSAK